MTRASVNSAARLSPPAIPRGLMRETLNPALPDVRSPLPEVRRPGDGARGDPAPAGQAPGGLAPADPAGSPPPARRRPRAPMVERIACWSARHRIAVIVGWLVLAGTALAAGQLLGTQSQQQYDPGQAGQAEQIVHQVELGSTPPDTR